MFQSVAKNVKKLIVCSLFVVFLIFSSVTVFAENFTELTTGSTTEVVTYVPTEHTTEEYTQKVTDFNNVSDNDKFLILISFLLLIVIFIVVVKSF